MFEVGVYEDRNARCRKSMEDTHTVKSHFMSSKDAGFFALFDGHAGKQTAEWCRSNFESILVNELSKYPHRPVVESLSESFLQADRQMSEQPSLKSSGSTAAVALVRTEHRQLGHYPLHTDSQSTKARFLYTANVGDARIVLARRGKALRLSHDHKPTDPDEISRIDNAGGLIINGRVQGVLAITRALGDLSVKDYVVSAPFTTETELHSDDTMLIIACDGLWDVCTDQQAVDIASKYSNPTEAAKALVEHALSSFSTDNITVIIINFLYDKS
ncbi:hypothetical protein CANCADRAFT_87718 [Tortispora caseinolytica NRRL Y-17796]|uniref:PPM-type phosphatase domain-containing protein n=1 Tax=Tortispora caseinolytica NRRL Y-17796 TaxID=767744 RepID=A0A1E4TL97_9ASCO|nr:hypothetical protein CANCADRAFT_87718 [Tortispora caseinolytica NRRL Y-17796]